MAYIVNTSPKPPMLVNTSPKPLMLDPAAVAAALGAEIVGRPAPTDTTPVTPARPPRPAEAVTPPPRPPERLMPDDYLCLTVAGRPGEPEAAFKGRLVAFWTHLLRTQPDLYGRVYAEATAFEPVGGAVTRQYMVEPGAVEAVTAELAGQGLGFEPVDAADGYSRDEASGRDWFQIPPRLTGGAWPRRVRPPAWGPAGRRPGR